MSDTEIRTFHHSRKGRLTGVVVRDDGEWVHLRLVGDHDPNRMYYSVENRAYGIADDGETLTVRKSFLTEIEEATDD